MKQKGKRIDLNMHTSYNIVDYGLVSVIVPVYKVEDELKRCVESLLGQTYRNIEIILVDDGSPDSCPQICDDFAQKDKRIKVIHKDNGGLASARNKGLDLAKGVFITFVDSDDWVESDFVETLINNLMREKADISIIGYTMIWDNGNERRLSRDDWYFVFEREQAIRELLIGQKYVFIVCQKMYRAYIFESIRFPEGKIYEDIAVGLPTFLLCNKVVMSGKSKYYYYQRNGSTVNSSFNENKLYRLKCCKDIIAYSDANGGLYDNEAHTYYLRSIMATLLNLYDTKQSEHYNDIKKELRSELSANKQYIWGNNCLKLRRKIVITLILLHFPERILYIIWKKRAGS